MLPTANIEQFSPFFRISHFPISKTSADKEESYKMAEPLGYLIINPLFDFNAANTKPAIRPEPAFPKKIDGIM